MAEKVYYGFYSKKAFLQWVQLPWLNRAPASIYVKECGEQNTITEVRQIDEPFGSWDDVVCLGPVGRWHSHTYEPNPQVPLNAEQQKFYDENIAKAKASDEYMIRQCQLSSYNWGWPSYNYDWQRFRTKHPPTEKFEERFYGYNSKSQ